MEVEVREEGRGRKRRIKDSENLSSTIRQAKKQVVETRSKAFVGRYVEKEFPGSGKFLGKVVSYDGGLYRIVYEDGDSEEFNSSEVREFLIEEFMFEDDLVMRMNKLDELIPKRRTMNSAVDLVPVKVLMEHEVSVAPLEGEVNCLTIESDEVAKVGGDVDSFSDSCEYIQDCDSCQDIEEPIAPPLELPVSSGNIGIPDNYVCHLFSVYTFLRSFSVRLFLSPFGLDDFVGSLNYVVPNTLFDCIHTCLMRLLRRHLEVMLSNGSDLSSKCLRCIDWRLLDMLTWPVFLFQYLITFGYAEGPEWKFFFTDAVGKEYYSLSVGRKLQILQIICDDLLESPELRADIDMREASEIGVDSDAISIDYADNVPWRVHPKYSKTSACKDEEAIGIISESNSTIPVSNIDSVKFPELAKESSMGEIDGDMDRNCDECRLCGMDGTLLCCDGCPSAYHVRCIGVSKMVVPEGSWFCPECAFDNFGPNIIRGTSLRAAEIFGVDLYGQTFLGTCNHLLVITSSMNAESCVRYYNHNDIPNLITSLISSSQHRSYYSRICLAILQYWKLPERLINLNEMINADCNLSRIIENAECSTIQNFNICSESDTVITDMDYGKSGGFSTIKPSESLPTSVSDAPIRVTNEATGLQLKCDTNTDQLHEHNLPPSTYSHKVLSDSPSRFYDPSGLTTQGLTDGSSMADLAVCNTFGGNADNSGSVSGICVQETIFCGLKENNIKDTEGGGNSSETHLYMGSLFKPQTYLNQYTQGEYAASAAANLAVLSSEENQTSSSQASMNHRKFLSADVLLQTKAFSSAASHFVWPHIDKKIVDIPRERCGWCLFCKAATTKRACLLNTAAQNALKGYLKVLSGPRPVNIEGSLAGIAAYILHTERNLRGLIVGPFINASFRLKWHKDVEEASTCHKIKLLLLKFEENIRLVAFSGDWLKMVDDGQGEFSTVDVACTSGSTQKRGPGRRGRKPSSFSEPANSPSDKRRDFVWWRGSKLSKLFHCRGILPRKVIKKISREAGSIKIHGVYYGEGLDVPKRSRQMLWRAAVEMSQNTSHLALQLRYLDQNIRWSDLIPPEHSNLDVKTPDVEASAFRNASICDIKVVDSGVRYGVAFYNQKHFTSRVLKSAIEVERFQDGMCKYWFLESRLPLYLIKDYEEKSATMIATFEDKQPTMKLSLFQKAQLKASRRDIFTYLKLRVDNLEVCYCASCQHDLLLRNAVKCSGCEGFCHMDCTFTCNDPTSDNVSFVLTCHRCYNANFPAPPPQLINSTPATSMMENGNHNTPSVQKKTGKKKSKSGKHSKLLESCPKRKSASSNSEMQSRNRKCSWGLIWKKKECEDDRPDFKTQRLILKGNPGMNLVQPICYLCCFPYNKDLMYICCESCENWYHADAVGLEESRLFELYGFKCCKCRRIKSPECPYSVKCEGSKVKKIRVRLSKPGGKGIMKTESPGFNETSWGFEDTGEDDDMQQQMPPVSSFGGGEDENSQEGGGVLSAAGLQKLHIRKHAKEEENNNNGYLDNDPYLMIDAASLMEPTGRSSPVLEMASSFEDHRENMPFDYASFDYGDMDFEPQTFFSYTELLALEDSGHSNPADPYVRDNNNSVFENTTPSSGMLPSCGVCSLNQPPPDLCCEICDRWTHTYCSSAQPEVDAGWRCQHCREWR